MTILITNRINRLGNNFYLRNWKSQRILPRHGFRIIKQIFYCLQDITPIKNHL